MSVSIVLIGYAVLAGIGAPSVLRRLPLAQRSPGLAAATWLVALSSVVVALILAAATAALENQWFRHGVADLLQACVNVLHHHYVGLYIGVPPASVAGLVVATAGLGWLALAGGRVAAREWRVRRHHHATLDLVGRRDDHRNVTVLDHSAVTAYCLPGRRGGRVVVTSAALVELGDEELAAVLAHERAHVVGRHHLLVTSVLIFCRAFPFLPLARAARPAVAFLVERMADERVCRDHDRHTVASALLAAGLTQAPAGTMGVGGGAAAHRVLHLLTPARGFGLWNQVAGWATIALLVLAPLALAAAPALGIAFASACALPPA